MKEFARTGFRGGLNWYRNIDRGWELMAPYAGALVTVPALYVAGDRDLVVAFRGMDQLIPNLKQVRAPPAAHRHAAGVRPLDAAGAAPGGQRGDARLPQVTLEGPAMIRSTARFLTTHTGSLPRPDDLIRMMFAREEGVPVDGAALGRASGRR